MNEKYDPRKLEAHEPAGHLNAGTFKHPEDENKLVSFLYEKNQPTLIKGRFYLTKIVHLLLPNNVRDIHMAGGEDNHVLEIEKKDLGEDYETTRQNTLTKGIRKNTALDDYEDRMYKDERYKTLVGRFKALGVAVDDMGRNFGFDTQGNMVYTESFVPWTFPMVDLDKSKVDSFDENRLRAAIEHLPEDQKKTAMSYLERLKELLEKSIHNLEQEGIKIIRE